MADKRISQLIERVDIANNDVLPIVASGATTTNKVTISTIQEWMQDNLDVGVTSVGITLGTSGTDVNVSGSPITSSGNITINIPDASATARGLLSSADWVTFNSKQAAGNYVTLDTTQTITAQKTFTTSGGTDTVIITHGSGSGIALDVIKDGSGVGLRVNKTSGSGNAATIIGTLEATTLVKTGGTSAQFLKADGSVDSTSYQPTLTNPITGTGVAGQVAFFNGTTTQTGDSGLVWNNTNKSLSISGAVGVAPLILSGTSVNIQMLGSGGAGSPITELSMERGASQRFAIQVGSGGGNAFDILNRNIAGSALRIVGSNNNVLINTTTDAGFRLDVNGTARLGALSGTSATFSGNVEITTNSGNSPLRFSSTTASSKTGYLYADADIIGITDVLNAGVGLDGIFFKPSTKETLLFNNGSISLNIASTGAATFSSSVTARSYVINNGGFRGGLYTYLDILGSGVDNSLTIFAESAANQGNIYFCPGGSATRQMTITSSGNVGIGTASPNERLQVETSIRIQGSTPAVNFYEGTSHRGMLNWQSTGGSVGIRLFNNDNSNLMFGTNGTEKVRIDVNGNVGIGTPSPGHLLHIKNDQAAYTWARIDNQLSSSSAYSGLQLAANGNTWGIAIGSSAANSNALTFVIDAGGGNTERMRITSGGIVQIANSSGTLGAITSARLNVNGDGLFYGSVTATAFFQSSDLRKKDVVKRDGDVAYFTWKDQEDTKVKVGYIAQEVQEVMPNAVSKDSEGMLSVDYIQVLVAKVAAMEKKIAQLENKN